MAASNQSINLTNLLLFLRTVEGNNTLAHQHLQQATEQVSRILPTLTIDGQVNVAEAQGQADLAFAYIENARELTILNQYNLAEYLLFFRVAHPELSNPATVPTNLRWVSHIPINRSPFIILEDSNDPSTAPPLTYHDTVRARAREYSRLLGMINPDGSIRYLPQPPLAQPTHILSELYTSDRPRITYPIELRSTVQCNTTRINEHISTSQQPGPSGTCYNAPATQTASFVPSSPVNARPWRRFWWRGARDEDLDRLEGIPIEEHVCLLTEYIHTHYPLSNNSSPSSSNIQDSSPESPFHDALVIGRVSGATIPTTDANGHTVTDPNAGMQERPISIHSSPLNSRSLSPRRILCGASSGEEDPNDYPGYTDPRDPDHRIIADTGVQTLRDPMPSPTSDSSHSYVSFASSDGNSDRQEHQRRKHQRVTYTVGSPSAPSSAHIPRLEHATTPSPVSSTSTFITPLQGPSPSPQPRYIHPRSDNYDDNYDDVTESNITGDPVGDF
ncbi:hypothetical protein K474DRAFT_1713440 [Panus rudis PR-1116 ss-1]|nr:hypothetical protein K474DRAFT_1713440 [Panus rudis PR-1116 ss-1]